MSRVPILYGCIYLRSFDIYMKEENNLSYYGRYVDDFYVVHSNAFFLKEIMASSKMYLKEKLGLILHLNKIFLQHYTKGVNYLGATIKPFRMYLSNRTKNNFKKCILKWELFLKSTIPTPTDLFKMRAAFNSYLGIMKHYSTYTIRYILLIKNRNKHIYIYGYIETRKHKKMLYCLYKLNY